MTAVPPPDPLHIAHVAQRLADNAQGVNNQVFHTVATVSMVVMATASAAQVLLPAVERLVRMLYPQEPSWHQDRLRHERHIARGRSR